MTTIEYLDRELKRTDISIRRAKCKPNTPPEELRGLQKKRVNLCKARAAVLEMQARPEAGKPLTLEQMREMDGRPAYWADDESWGIISVDDAGRWAGIPFFRGRKNGVNFEYDIVSRGMEVYPYAPARIDREKWGLCEFCGYTEYPGKKLYPKDGYLFYAGYTKQYAVDSFHEEETEDVKFCPRCGRPLTEEAWEELERRVFGEV